ncbi:hypothetical protein NQ314_008353 [Rhamnusium bicolor]|uniref:Uncharacterized protein n=1 Tax=Rhamnusium bicolor TaxID=1586634 RepID=A0AAV8YB02_9CUCU|nr:hypothetical protein NQ314_008353 [Rhamnusium bicolor]
MRVLKNGKEELLTDEAVPSCSNISKDAQNKKQINNEIKKFEDIQKEHKNDSYSDRVSDENQIKEYAKKAKRDLFKEEVGPTCYSLSAQGISEGKTNDSKTERLDNQKQNKIKTYNNTEQKSKTCNDQLIHVSKDEAKITERGRDYNSEKQREKKLGASTAESKIVKSSNMNEQRENSDKNKRFSEDSRCFKKERRKLDESKKSVESASLVRYSDYKKSVDLSKKSPPPEMSLCTIMGVRKKITSRRTTFSNENELYLQRMYRLFGSDSDHEQEEKDETKSKKHDDKSAGTKRKVDKDHGSHKREPQQKKSFTESYRKHPSKAKSVDIHRRNSVHGSSAREDDPKKLIIMDKNAYDIPNSNISQKANTSALVNKSSQHKTSHLNNKTLSRSKDISKSKRSSTATTSVESNKTVGSSNKDKYCEKRRVSMSVPSVNEITTSQKSFPEKSDKTERSANKNNLSNNSEDSFASKAINNRIKDKNSKHFKGDSSPKSESRTSSLNNKEKCRLFVDVRKNQLYQVEEYSKKQEKQPKVGKNPTVVENIGRENVKENWHRDKEVNSPIDQNNKGGTRFDEHTVKEQRNVSPIQACDNQNDGISGSMKVQKQIDQSKTTYNKSLLNNVSISSTVLQPKLVLSRIDSQISVNAKMDSNAQKNRKVDVATKEKELPIKKAIETFALELSFMKFRRCSVTEDDCCDRAVILESPDVRDKIEIAKQVVIPFPNISNFDQKESSDDVIEIKPDIPIIDLTSEANEMKDEKCLDPPKNNISVKPDEKNDLDLVLEIANNTTGEERITLYRSEETLNNSLDLQAMVASISSSVLSNDDNKTCEDIKIDEDIKTDDKSVGAVSNTVTDKTVPSSQPNTHKKQVPNRGDTIKSAASNIEKSTSVPVPQKSSSHISGLTQLLIEKAINDAFNLREQQSSNLNSTNNNSQANKETSTSGTNKPPTSTSKSIAQKSSTVNIKSVGIPDTSSCQDSTATININVRDPPPYPVQNNTTGTDNITVHNRWNENSGTDPSYAVAQSQRGTESNQITFGFLPQNLRTYANVKKRHAVTQNQSRPDNNSTQMPFETITQSPISEQNSFMAAQTPRQTQNNIAPRTKNSGSEQSLLIASTNQFQNTIQAGPNAISMSPGCTENNTSGQNFFVMSQTPKRMENRVPASLVTQSSRVEQSSNAQNAIGINKTNEQLPLPLTSQSVGQFGAGSPLRNLQLLVANEPEQMQEISYMELNYVGLTLTRYLCYYDGLKKAQLMYSEEIRKLARCLPTIVKQELAQFDNNNYVQFYSLSKEMFKDLKNLNIKASTTNFLKIRTLMKSVYTAMKQIIPNVTISWFYLMLGAMIEPELIQYKSKPFLKDLCNYVTYVSSQIYTRNISVQHQGAAENNVPVKLVAMENSLQTNLLKAQQDNISTKVKQNKASSMSARVEGGVMHCRSSGQNTGGTIQAQSLLEYWKNADIENISITPSPVVSVSDAGKGPSVPNVCLSSGGGVPQFKEVRNETLKSYLLSNNSKTSGKRSYPNPAHTNLATQASKQPSTSSSNLTVHSNIVINPTLVNAPTLPKKNISNVANVIRPTATANLSPNLLQMRPSLSKLGTNEIYKIRLPFTKPYDVSCPSPPTTSAPVLKTVVQSSPVQSTIQTGSSMPLLSEDINLPNLSHIQSIGPSPVYAPMAFVHPVVNSLSPPLEISEEPTSSAVENVSHTNDNNSNLPEVKPSTSKESFNTDNSPHVKSETDLQLSDKDIETIDLTWLDDIDPEQLQSEIEFISVKKEEPMEKK